MADFGLSQDDEGGNLLYVVKYKDFTFVDHGSAGSLDPLEPGQQEVKDALRKIGADDQVDLEMGGIAELQNYFNGLIDERRYSEQIQPQGVHADSPRQLEPAGHLRRPLLLRAVEGRDGEDGPRPPA